MDTGRVLALVTDPRLNSLISFLQVPSTLAQLESTRADGAAKAAAAGVRANSGINIKDNTAELYVADSAQLKAGLGATGAHLPSSLRIVEGVVTHEASDIYGGLYTNDCTTGFSVRDPYTGYKGFTVAGHCANTQVRDGYSFAFMGGTGGGDYDIQWNWESGFQAQPLVWTGSYATAIYAVIFRSSQYVGEYVCKYGKTTGGGYRFIQDKSWNGVNVRVNIPVSSGDSGGPWFQNQAAFGTTIAFVVGSGDAIYGPVDHIYNVLGVSIMTY